MSWFWTFKLLVKRCGQNNHAKKFSMLKECFEIFISCFRWLAWNNDNRNVVWPGKCNACRFDLSPKRWTWQNSQEKYIENWGGSENVACCDHKVCLFWGPGVLKRWSISAYRKSVAFLFQPFTLCASYAKTEKMGEKPSMTHENSCSMYLMFPSKALPRLFGRRFRGIHFNSNQCSLSHN